MNQSMFVQTKDSITVKLLKIVFVVYFIITLSLTLGHMYAEYENTKDAVKAELENLETIFKPSLVAPMWVLNRDQVEDTVRGILKSAAVVGVRVVPSAKTPQRLKIELGLVRGDRNRVAYHKIDKSEKKQVDTTQALITHEFQLKHGKQQTLLADVYFFSSEGIVIDRVKFGFMVIVMNAIIKTLALWLLFIWAGDKFLSRPLKVFINAVGGIRLDNLQEVHVTNPKERNELNILEHAFNKTIGHLRHAVKEEKSANERTAHYRTYLQSIIDSMPSIIIGIDPNKAVTHLNKHAEDAIGKSSKEILGKPIMGLLPQLQGHDLTIINALRRQVVERIEKVAIEYNGMERFYDVTIFPLNDQNQGLVIRIDDITERVNLEKIVVQREMMNTVGKVSVGLATEVMSPLSVIVEGLQNVRSRFDLANTENKQVAEKLDISVEKLNNYLNDRKIINFLEGLRTVGEKATDIVEDIVKFYRQDENIDLVPNDINAIIARVINLINSDPKIAEQVNWSIAKFETHYDLDMPSINCSATQIERVILNVLKNAVEAIAKKTDKTDTTIDISTSFNNDYANITIQDKGVGIAERLLPHVFEPFVTTKPSGQGIGLGLSISYYVVVNRHKGQLLISSEVGQGTTVIIKLPNLGRVRQTEKSSDDFWSNV